MHPADAVHAATKYNNELSSESTSLCESQSQYQYTYGPSVSLQLSLKSNRAAHPQSGRASACTASDNISTKTGKLKVSAEVFEGSRSVDEQTPGSQHVQARESITTKINRQKDV